MRRVLKLAAIASLGITSISAGFLYTIDQYRRTGIAILALVAGLIAATVQINDSFLGLAVLVASAVAFPFEFGGGSRSPLNSSILIAGAICAIWILGVVLKRRRAIAGWGRPAAAALVFMACATLSLIGGLVLSEPVPGAPLGAQAAQLYIFLISAGIFVITGDLVRSEERLQQLTYIFLACGFLACITDFIPPSHFPGLTKLMTRVISPATIGSMFWAWIVAISMSQAVFNRRLQPAVRLMLAGLTVVALTRGIVIARSWASGWLPSLVAALVILALRFPKFAVIAAILGALAVSYLSSGGVSFSPKEEEYSAMTRGAAAQVLWPFIKSHPVFGMGPANYYYYVSASPILGWYVKFNSHNQYLDLAAQVGAVGLVAFAWVVFEIGAASLRLRRQFRDGFAGAYLAGALAGLAASVVAGALADWILPFYYNVGLGGLRSSLLFWIFTGGVAVIARSGAAKGTPGLGATAKPVQQGQPV